jgi:hypothetical protein
VGGERRNPLNSVFEELTGEEVEIGMVPVFDSDSVVTTLDPSDPTRINVTLDIAFLPVTHWHGPMGKA